MDEIKKVISKLTETQKRYLATIARKRYKNEMDVCYEFECYPGQIKKTINSLINLKLLKVTSQKVEFYDTGYGTQKKATIRRFVVAPKAKEVVAKLPKYL